MDMLILDQGHPDAKVRRVLRLLSRIPENAKETKDAKKSGASKLTSELSVLQSLISKRNRSHHLPSSPSRNRSLPSGVGYNPFRTTLS